MIIDLPDPRDITVAIPPVTVPRRQGVGRRALLFARGIAEDIKASMRPSDQEPRNASGRSDLDDTRPYGTPSVPPNDSEFRVNDRRAQIPQWLLLVILIQGGGGIWWAATMQSENRYNRQEILRLEAKLDAESRARVDAIQVLGLQRDKDKDNIRDVVRDEIANQLLSRGVIRIQP